MTIIAAGIAHQVMNEAQVFQWESDVTRNMRYVATAAGTHTKQCSMLYFFNGNQNTAHHKNRIPAIAIVPRICPIVFMAFRLTFVIKSFQQLLGELRLGRCDFHELLHHFVSIAGSAQCLVHAGETAGRFCGCRG